MFRGTLWLLPLAAACAAVDPDAAAPASFTVAFIPDSQVYAESAPDVLDRHLKWLVDHAEEWNLVYVGHVGDIVDDADQPAQWEAADAAYRWLREADIPHGLTVGNHDYLKSCDREDLACQLGPYLEVFGPERYADRPWYGGASPSGASNYQRVEAGGLELLFLQLPHDVPAAEARWANEVLADHPSALAHLTTHRFLYDYRLTDALPPPLDLFDGGRFNFLFYSVLDQPLRFEDSLSADEIFDEVVAPNPNVWSIHCGHVDAEFRQQIATNVADLPVHEVLVDFQSMRDGGNGLLRLLRYTPALDRVEAFTVSTETGVFRENGEGFDHSVDLLGRFADRGVGAVEDLGFSTEEMIALLAEIEDGGPFAETYRASLYDGGQRDSRFDLEVDFDAYTEAAR